MWNVARSLARHTLAVTAFGVSLAVLALGGFAFLVHQLPSYRGEIEGWVSDTLGVRLQFAQLDGRWGLSGPEVTFRAVSVTSPDETAPFLSAQEASVGFSPFALIAQLATGRDLKIDRLTFEGTELTLVREPNGSFRLQGGPGSDTRRAGLALDLPSEVDVLVQGSRVHYFDPARSLSWSFDEVEARLSRGADALVLEASARPPAELGSSVELTAQGLIGDGPRGAQLRNTGLTGDWRVSVEFADIDLAAVANVLPDVAVAPQAGVGDVAVAFEWQRGMLARSTVSLALSDVLLPPIGAAAGATYERVALSGEWLAASDGWRVRLNDVAVTRAGRVWPSSSNTEIEFANGPAGGDRLSIKSDFVRLEDLTPFLWPLPRSRAVESWLALAPRGDLRGAELTLQRAGDGIDYTVAAQFERLGVEPFEDLPGFDSLTGEIRTDSRSGRAQLESRGMQLDWPALFGRTLDVTELSGLFVWRQGQDGVRWVSDDLVLRTPDGSTRSNLELTLPLDGSSPLLDLTTTISAFDAPAALRYLPVRKMSPGLVAWLEGAIRAGRVRGAQLSFVGPVRAFPFDGGEGELRVRADVEDGMLAFVRDWPVAEELDGTIEFVNASFAARGSGRVLGNRSADVRTGIADLRDPLFTLQADTIGPLDQVLAFLNSAPLIAQHLGSEFARLESPFGTGEVSLDLRLPLRDRAAYDLTASLDITDGELAFAGFAPRATEISGTLSFADNTLHGEGLDAVFLDGPVKANVSTAQLPGYRARLDFEGEVSIDAVADTFNLPFPELLAGQTRWQGSLYIPAAGEAASAPPRITIGSNLSGVALRYPQPLTKAPAEALSLQLDLLFAADGELEVSGNIGASRRFAMQFAGAPRTPRSSAAAAADRGRFQFQRAALRFGGALPEFRFDRGVSIDGSLAALPLDEWIALVRGAAASGVGQMNAGFAGGDLELGEFTVFGQRLGAAKLGVRRRTDDWQIEIDSAPVSGTILVPIDLRSDRQAVAVMRRLHLSAGELSAAEGSAARGSIDPRRLPGLQLHADEFGVGQRRLGRVDAEILADPLGLRLVSFESGTASFTAQGSGGWFRDERGDTTRFAVSVSSSNVGGMLNELGFDPFIEAKTADITASVHWPGPPSGAWLDHVSGDLALRADTGSLIDVDPGAGRMVGLLSISALPRRLALDFRDVFNRGLVFDEITADFTINDGNAYTDNLKLTGPVAEVGIIGRTGLRDRDYRQQAIVTAEPGKMLPTVGGLIGGPGVAAALLIFTRIFKEPLKGIGRASYCVTGQWQAPVVERLTAEQLEQGEICAELPPNMPRTAVEIAGER